MLNIAICILSLSFAKASDNTYIIAFNNNEKSSFQANARSVTDLFTGKSPINSVKHHYKHGFKGMAVNMDDITLAKARMLSNVKYIVPDGTAYGSATQSNAPWGLSRISHRNRQNKYETPEYLYDSNAGEGITIYVIDSGINTNHTDFGGRATWGVNKIAGTPDIDEHGHGTHCAGTAGSNTYGVAKKAKLVAVKVLNSMNQGTWSDIIAGVDWVVENANSANSVISFSIGGNIYLPMDDAINAAYESGFFVSVAAMNDNRDACLVSPARAKYSFTVGGSDIDDNKYTGSNWGKCVSILGPAVNVLSTYIGSNNATAYLTGTSMATPHIAGIAATFLSQGTKFEDLKTKILNTATKNAIKGFDSETPNLLGYNGYSKY